MRRRCPAPACSGRHNAQPQGAANDAVAYQLCSVPRGVGVGPLQTDRDMRAGGARGGGQFLRLGQIAPQRPFAIDVLVGLQSCQDDGPVFRHFHGDGDDVDVRIAGERERVVIGAHGAKQRGRFVSNTLRARGDGLSGKSR